MTQTANQPAFPLAKAAIALTVMAVVVLALAYFVVPGLFGQPRGAELAVAIMVAVVWVSGLVSLIPMKKVVGQPALAVVKAFFLGMAVRVAAGVLMMVVAIKSMKLPAGPVAVSLMFAYGMFLFVETRLVTRFLRDSAAGRMDSPPFQGGAGGGSSELRDLSQLDADRPTLPQPLPKREGSSDTVSLRQAAEPMSGKPKATDNHNAPRAMHGSEALA